MQNTENTDEKPHRESARRWKEGGWETHREASGFFRRVWQKALEEGKQAGDSIGPWHTLLWLVKGHPNYDELSAHGIAYFTFAPDGRGNHRFAIVDKRGEQHPFSTNVALTGFVEPLRLPHDDANPFKGTTS